jgi:homoserine acetyltransferase
LPKKSIDYKVVETMVEVEVALEKWKRLNKPTNMVVVLATGLSTD